MASDTQNATLTDFPLVIPTMSGQPTARLVLRNKLGQVVQQWLLKQNKCTLGSAASCSLRCSAAGIAPYHALIVIGARQIFVRALAPKLTRDGNQVNEILLTDDNGTFEIAGHPFELSRVSLSEETDRLRSSGQDNRMKFTLARPFALQNRANVASPNADLPSAASANEPSSPWVAKLVQSAVEPLECQLQNVLEPIAELQAEMRRQRRLRRKRLAAKRERAARGEHVEEGAADAANLSPEAQAHVQSVAAQQAAAMEAFEQRISNVNEQLDSIQRLAAQERESLPASPAMEQQVQTQNSAIEQLQTGIVAVSAALQSLQERHQATHEENLQWKEAVQTQLGEIAASLHEAHTKSSAGEIGDAALILEELQRLQRGQAESQQEIDRWKNEIQEQMAAIQGSLSESQPHELTNQVQELQDRQAESLQDVANWKGEILTQISELQASLQHSSAEPTTPTPTAGPAVAEQRWSSSEVSETLDAAPATDFETERHAESAASTPTDEVAEPDTFEAVDDDRAAVEFDSNFESDAQATAPPTDHNEFVWQLDEAPPADEGEALPDQAEGQVAEAWASPDTGEASEGAAASTFESQADVVESAEVMPDQAEALKFVELPAESAPVDEEVSDVDQSSVAEINEEEMRWDAPAAESTPDTDESSLATEQESEFAETPEFFFGSLATDEPPQTDVDAEYSDSPSFTSLTDEDRVRGEATEEPIVEESAAAASFNEELNAEEASGLPDWWVEPSSDSEATHETLSEHHQADTLSDDATPQQALLDDVSSMSHQESAASLDAIGAAQAEDEFYGLGISDVSSSDSQAGYALDERAATAGTSPESPELESPELESPELESHFAAQEASLTESPDDEFPTLTADLEVESAVQPEEAEPTIDQLADAEVIDDCDATDAKEEYPDVAASIDSVIGSPDDGEAEEDSVEDYMRKLLARMRGVPEEEVELTLPKSEPPKTTVVNEPLREVKDSQPLETSSAATDSDGYDVTGDPTAPFDPEKYVPRALATEAKHDLKAMRELANSSARTAIDTSTRQRHVASVLLKITISGVGFTVAAVLIAINGFNVNLGLIATFASLVVACIWGYDALVSIRPLLKSSLVLDPPSGQSEEAESAEDDA